LIIFNISGCAFTFRPLILRRGTGRWDPGFPPHGGGNGGGSVWEEEEEGVSKVTGIGTNYKEKLQNIA